MRKLTTILLNENSEELVKDYKIKLGKSTHIFTLNYMKSSGNWNVTDKSHAIVLSGYYYNGRVGINDSIKEIKYFENELLDFVKKNINK